MLKKIVLYLLTLLVLLLCLSSCNLLHKDKTYTVEQGRYTYTVDTEECTITCASYVVDYKITKYASTHKGNIYYPDGSSFWWETTSSGITLFDWSKSYDPPSYLAGEVLVHVLEEGVLVDRSGKIFPAFFLLVLGLVHILAPIGMWACYFGMYREGEPDEGELIGIRILGGLILLGTAAWFWDWF